MLTVDDIHACHAPSSGRSTHADRKGLAEFCLITLSALHQGLRMRLYNMRLYPMYVPQMDRMMQGMCLVLDQMWQLQQSAEL